MNKKYKELTSWSLKNYPEAIYIIAYTYTGKIIDTFTFSTN